MAILKLLLDHGIIDISQDLQPLQLPPHAVEAPLLVLLSTTDASILLFQARYPSPLVLDLLDLVGTVGREHLTRFLKALVGQLLEGKGSGRDESGTASTRADWDEPLVLQETLLLGDGRDAIRVQKGSGRRR